MERFILSWDSGGRDKTAVAITKIYSKGTEILGEVVLSGVGSGSVFLDELEIYNEKSIKAELEETTQRAKRYFEEKEELLRREYERKERTLKKVEKALGLTLFDWQKEYIFEGKPYGKEICFARCAGKTLAHCLRLCLSDGEPVRATLTPPVMARNEFLRYLGEDGETMCRSRGFIQMLREIYEKLKAAGGIDLREIVFFEVPYGA